MQFQAPGFDLMLASRQFRRSSIAAVHRTGLAAFAAVPIDP